VLGTRNQSLIWGPEKIALSDRLEARLIPNEGLGHDCDGGINDLAKCRTSDSPEVLLWGDSYAMHLADGLLASHPGLKLRQATLSVCGPVFGIAPLLTNYGTAFARRCIDANDKVLALLHTPHAPRYVVIGSLFGQYTFKGAKVFKRDGSSADGEAVFASYFEQTLMEIRKAGAIPVVVYPPPSGGFDIGLCLKRASYFDMSLRTCDFSEGDSLDPHVLKVLNGISTARVVRPSDLLCGNGTCSSSVDGVFIYRDGGHLSHEGSAYLGKHMDWYSLIATAN